MSLKVASFLGLIGTLMLTIMFTVDFINAVSGVIRGLLPAMVLPRSLALPLAFLGITVFFYVFHRSQSR